MDRIYTHRGFEFKVVGPEGSRYWLLIGSKYTKLTNPARGTSTYATTYAAWQACKDYIDRISGPTLH